jgi:Flp pilus assembly protein TadG
MDEKGQAMVEFALTALVLISLLLALIDLAMMFYVNLTMQHAVREGARYAITGQIGASSDRRAAMIQKIKDSSCDLYNKNALAEKDPTVSVLTPSHISTFTNYTGNQVVDTGKPDQIIIVRLTYAWPTLTPLMNPFFTDGRYTFTASATMKNEQWGP